MLFDSFLRKKGYRPLSLCPTEVREFWHPPTDTMPVQKVQSTWVPPRNPKKVEIDPHNPDHIKLGYILDENDQWIPIGVPFPDFRFLAHMTAPMGRGKSVFLGGLFSQVMNAGRGCLVLDCKGTDLKNECIVRVPRERESDVALLDISGSDITGDQMYPAMNLFSPQFARSMNLNNSKLASTLLQVFSVIDNRFKDATIMPLFAMMGTVALLESEPQATLAHLMRFFYDEDYRDERIPLIKNPTVRAFWEVRFPGFSDQQLSPLRGFENRVDRLMGFEEIAAMMIAPGCSINLRKIMDNQGILLAGIKVSDGEMANLAAMLLLTQLQIAALSRNNIPESQREDFLAIIDEAQIVYGLSPGLGEIQFSQFRGLRVGSVIVHQNMEQLSPDLMATLIGNAQIRLIIGAEARDAKTYEGLYEGLSASDYTGMTKFYHEYIKIHGPMFTARMPEMTPPLDEELPPIVYQNWKTIRAPSRGALDQKLDDLIISVQILSRDPRRKQEAIDRLANLPDALFDEYCRRTRRNRQAQAAFIRENPGCIPIPPGLTGHEAMLAQKDQRIRTLNALLNMFPDLETKALQRKLLLQMQQSIARREAREATEKESKKKKSSSKGRLRDDGSDPSILAASLIAGMNEGSVSTPTSDETLPAPELSADELAEYAGLIADVFGEDEQLTRSYTRKLGQLEEASK